MSESLTAERIRTRLANKKNNEALADNEAFNAEVDRSESLKAQMRKEANYRKRQSKRER